MTAFQRYAPFIQEYIYRKQWHDLHQVQVDACQAILDRDSHVLIASGTASGKTEAAFFPMLTDLEKKPGKSIDILYISPLKALINDQFSRLAGLLEEQEIPVFPWHGDVSSHQKKKAMTTARGILQITPESLEAMLMHRAGEAKRLFSHLRYVVIDEIHAFMGSDRGLQLMCLLTRIERITCCCPRRIGLSATLHEYEPALDFLAMGSSRKGEVVGTQQESRRISLSAQSFFIPDDSDLAQEAWQAYYDFLYQVTKGKKCLIFTNNRRDAEKTISELKDIAEIQGERDVFYVHHGAVSAALREETEEALREEQRPTVAAATVTLELGIDIGDLDFTVQLGAPYSCSSFVQRLGRSGRRTGKSQMLFLDAMEEKDKDFFDPIPWNLLRAIAVIQLYAEEKWVEPFEVKEKPFSLLVHQTLSILLSQGDISPASLAREVLSLAVFSGKITQDEFRQVLQHLLEIDFLSTLENGNLLVGLRGERFTQHYSFYAVFQEQETYHVRGKEGDIGTLDSCPQIGEVFVLAGRTWQVIELDEGKKIIFVNSVKTKRLPSWRGTGGRIHTKVVQRMKKALEEETLYPYLRESAVITLEKAREYCRSTGLLEKQCIPYGNQSFYLCPWVGTKEMLTLRHLLGNGLKKPLEIMSVMDGMYYLQITANLSPQEMVEKLSQLTIHSHEPSLVLPPHFVEKQDKYDALLPDSLLRIAFLQNQLSVEEGVRILQQITTPPSM